MPITFEGKRYNIFVPYCEKCPSREMVEHAGKTWTPEMQAEWDRHQKCYATHLIAVAHADQLTDIDQMHNYLAKYAGNLFVSGKIDECETFDREATDEYGGKIRGGERDGRWALARCLCCDAVTRHWPLHDKVG